jgi:hypothetical protein
MSNRRKPEQLVFGFMLGKHRIIRCCRFRIKVNQWLRTPWGALSAFFSVSLEVFQCLPRRLSGRDRHPDRSLRPRSCWSQRGRNSEWLRFFGANNMADATGYHVNPNPKADKIELLLLESVDHVSRLVLEPKDVSVIAGQLLGAAAQVFEQSGKPPPNRTKDDKISAKAVRCSGWNIGPGNQPGQVSLIFHFGETTLAIQMPQEHAQLLSQRLITAAAPEDQSRRQ